MAQQEDVLMAEYRQGWASRAAQVIAPHDGGGSDYLNAAQLIVNHDGGSGPEYVNVGNFCIDDNIFQ